MNSSRDYIFNKIFEQLSVKEPELARPIIPVKEWVKDEFYVGKDGLKLYPFWQNVIEDIFESGAQYNQIVLSGGIGCRPLYIKYETSEGSLSLKDINKKLRNSSIFINTEIGIEKIIDTHIVGEKDVLRLILSNGVVFDGSDDHLIKVFDGSTILFKQLKDITIYDNILVTTDKVTPINDLSYSNSTQEYKDYSYVKLVKKENLGYQLVGDIEVEGSHTYISDGLINHNTGKSTCGIYILIRKLYELSCYKNIQGKFH